MIHRNGLCVLALLLAACETPTELPPPPAKASAGSISGRVVISMPGSAELDAAGGAHIQLLTTSLSATADSDGRFYLTPITRTTGTLLLQADPDSTGTYQHQRLIDLSTLGVGPGHDISLGDVELSENATVVGRAVPADMEHAETGLGGTAVFVPQGPFTAYTGDDGTFILDNVPQGPITLSFFRAGYAPATVGGIQLSPGQVLQLTDTILTPQPAGPNNVGNVGGQVDFSPTVSDPETTVGVAVGGSQQVSVSIAHDGSYMATVPEGLYTLSFSYPGYGTGVAANVLVLPGTTITVPTVVMDPPPPLADGGVALVQDAGTPFDAGIIDAGIMVGPGLGAPTALISTIGAALVGAQVQLDGTLSTAPLASPGSYLSYHWSQTSGDDVTASFSLNDSVFASKLTFTAPATAQTLVLALTVTDTRTGLTGSTTATVNVTLIPTALITPAARSASPGAQVTFDGSGSTDPAGAVLSYGWTSLSAGLDVSSQATASSVTFDAPTTPGEYQLQLVVSDPFFSSVPTTATLTVTAVAPTVHLVAPSAVQVGAPVTMTAYESIASGAQPGQDLSYDWQQTAGTSVLSQFTANNSILAGSETFTDSSGVDALAFTVTVTDTRTGATASASATIEVLEAPLAVVSPLTATVHPGGTVKFDGSGSQDFSGAGLTYAWSSTASEINLTGQSTNAFVNVTAPETPGTYSVQLVVTDIFLSSAPATAQLIVEAASVPPQVTTPATLTATAGATVQLVADGQAPDPITYQWTQTSGPAVSLAASTTATATFVAPRQYTNLGFQVTATSLGGVATASVAVMVTDNTPITVVSSDPDAASGVGSWLCSTVTFDRPLDPSSVTSQNLFLTDGAAHTVAATVEYVGATQTARVVPLVPLISGASYTLTVGAVRDLAPAPNIHASQTIPFAARHPTWTTWVDTNAQSTPPNPGVAANDTEALVFVTYDSAPCPGFSDASLSPSSGGSLSLVASCVSATPGMTPITHRGMSLDGLLLGLQQSAASSFPNGGSFTVWQRTTEGFIQIGPAGGATWFTTFTDGQDLFMIEQDSYYDHLYSYTPAAGSWGAAQIVNLSGSNFYASGGTGEGGDEFVMQRSGDGHLFAFESPTGGTWAMVPGAADSDAVAWISAADPGTGVPVGVVAAGAPFFAWASSGTVDEIDGAALDRSTTPPTWSTTGRLNDIPAATYFDLEARGNVVLFAYVDANGLLRLRQLDVSNPASPATTQFSGPAGLDTFNTAPGCLASHPEIASIDGAIYVTWAESCTAGAWTVQLARME